MSDYALIFLQQPAAQPAMTTGGWLFLTVSWFFIILLTIWSFSKILGKK